MSKADLIVALEQIEKDLEKSSESYRDITSDIKTHTLTLYRIQVFKETWAQLRSLGISNVFLKENYQVIWTGCTDFVSKFGELITDYKPRKLTKTQFVNESFVRVTLSQRVSTESGPGNIFRALRAIKQSAQKNYYAKIEKLITDYNTQNNTKILFDKSSFIDIGHMDDTSVAQQIATSQRAALNKVLNEYQVNFAITRVSETGRVEVSVELQSANKNRGSISKQDAKLLVDLKRDLKTILARVDTIGMEGSDSIMLRTIKSIYNPLAEDLAKNPKVKTDLKVNPIVDSETVTVKSTKKTKNRLVPISNSEMRSGGTKPRKAKSIEERETPESKINLRRLIPQLNARLPLAIIKRMVYPALVNRTGRFAYGARITDITQTPKGYPSIVFTYDKRPYGVFQRGLGILPWATPPRNPPTIINTAIRDIAKEYMEGRFYTRHV